MFFFRVSMSSLPFISLLKIMKVTIYQLGPDEVNKAYYLYKVVVQQ
jgi:hypothetical protein